MTSYKYKYLTIPPVSACWVWIPPHQPIFYYLAPMELIVVLLLLAGSVGAVRSNHTNRVAI